MRPSAGHSWAPLILGILFTCTTAVVIVRYLTQARQANDDLIADHIVQLKDIFKRINDRCKITGFRYPKDQIDFLNVISFSGSVVGSMNLLEPQHWEGPYLQENLVIEGKEYQIIQTKKGHFIVPGDGVKLANGKVIGKTLSLTPDSDIEAMLYDHQALLSGNRSLGGFIETYQSLHESYNQTHIPLEEIETLD
jgi:hypothetical protein